MTLREVHREYQRTARDKPVDYALLIDGAPRLFIEAKRNESGSTTRVGSTRPSPMRPSRGWCGSR